VGALILASFWLFSSCSASVVVGGRLVGGRRVGVAACFAGCVGRGTLMGVLVLGGCFGSAGVAGLAPGYGVRAPVVGVLAVWGGR
jgi:hypothetical protein